MKASAFVLICLVAPWAQAVLNPGDPVYLRLFDWNDRIQWVDQNIRYTER